MAKETQTNNNEQRNQKLYIRHVPIIFNSIAGDDNGKRAFTIGLTDEQAQEYAAMGLNVRFPQPKPDIDPADDRRTPLLNITVSTNIDEIPGWVKLCVVDKVQDSVYRIPNHDLKQIDSLLGNYRFGDVDLKVTMSPYDFRGRQGIALYCDSAYFDITAGQANDEEDELAKEYGV